MELLKKQLLTALTRKDYTPLSPRNLAQSIGVPQEKYPAFQAALEQLQRNKQVVIDNRKNVNLPAMGHRVIGTFRANERGFGFIIPLQANAYGDLFVSPADTGGAMNNDVVAARAVKKGHRGGQMRYSGIITDIIERGNDRFVGTLKREQGLWMVQPESKGFYRPILVDDVTASGAKEGDKIVLEIVSYPTKDIPARGAIVEVLGEAGLYDTEIRSIMTRFGLPDDFGDECRQQARQATENFTDEKIDGRSDICDEVIITIDPPDAKDFDDAISLTKDASGHWQLGVHIADVSSFIEQDSPLDKEARVRGNSVYLPKKVIPMLPEVLSNGICSLQPDQRRFAKSVYITYDLKGNILGREVDNSVICSRKRLTYLEADAILKGDAEGYAGEVVALLKDMELLARAIEKRRAKNGMLHLDLPETELVYDDDGQVVDAHPADDSYPHTIIEMFMVEANEAVAGLLDRFEVAFMRRIHPEPNAITTKNLERFVRVCGLKIPRQLDRAAIGDLLAAVKDTPLAHAVNLYVLRSMQKAEYSPLHIGHFALASTHYCHFTSPIRRYADLLVHRLIDCYIKGKLNKIGPDEVLSEGELIEIGKHISFTELQAAKAEKELKTVLILQMLSERVGEDMAVVVSGLTNFGVFVQCTTFGIEGMIEPGDLGLDEWKYDERAQAVVGKWSGESVHLGQPMKVRIAAVNIPARQLFLAPAEPLVSERPKLNRRKFKRKHHTRKKRKR
ncbi:MAG: ribonuclease R [Planctomycetota bacterium]|nr:MAG: ribonuclease R [Planctomycetota bacterium]